MIKLYHFDELKPEEILNRDIRAEKNEEDVVDEKMQRIFDGEM